MGPVRIFHSNFIKQITSGSECRCCYGNNMEKLIIGSFNGACFSTLDTEVFTNKN